MSTQVSNHPPISDASDRRKFELDLVHKFRRIFGPLEVFRSTRARQAFRSPTVETPYFWIETAQSAKADPLATLNKAIQRCDLPERWRLAITERPGQPTTVAMTLDDFLALLKLTWPNPVTVKDYADINQSGEKPLADAIGSPREIAPGGSLPAVPEINFPIGPEWKHE